MYVDGASHRPKVEDVQVPHRPPDAKSNGTLYLPEASHPAHILRDTFERIQAARAVEATYSDKEDLVRSYDNVASVIDELRGTLDQDYQDAIARFESEIETTGAPPNSDRSDDALVYRSFIEAYDSVSVNHAGVPDSGAHELLDTAG